MQNTMAETPNEQNMNDILASIRQTITGELGINIEHSPSHGVGSFNNSSHDDVLELTQQVQDDGSIVDLHRQIADLKSKFQSLSEFNADMTTPDENKHIPYFAHDVPSPQPQSAQFKHVDDERTIVDQGMSMQAVHPMDAKIYDGAGISDTKAEQNAKAIDDIESMAEKFASSYNKQQEPIPSPTFEELLKPMLKEWLDTNLPSLVKWIVTEQIERIMKERKI